MSAKAKKDQGVKPKKELKYVALAAEGDTPPENALDHIPMYSCPGGYYLESSKSRPSCAHKPTNRLFDKGDKPAGYKHRTCAALVGGLRESCTLQPDLLKYYSEQLKKLEEHNLVFTGAAVRFNCRAGHISANFIPLGGAPDYLHTSRSNIRNALGFFQKIAPASMYVTDISLIYHEASLEMLDVSTGTYGPKPTLMCKWQLELGLVDVEVPTIIR
jgi:hypothetical protein